MASLRFLSLNFHGFNVGISSYLSSIVSMYDIVLLLETWLSEFNCHRLGLILVTILWCFIAVLWKTNYYQVF